MGKVRVDMTGVESQSIIPEGKYAAKVIKAEEDTNGQGNDQIIITFEITKGPEKGTKIKNFFVLVDTALWKLKEFLVAVGMKADGKISIDLDKLVGKTCDIAVFTDEYNGTERSKISSYSKPGSVAAKGGKKADPDDDDDEDTDDDEYDDDEDEASPRKSKKSSKGKKEKAPPAKKSKRKPESEDDDEDEDDEDDEDDTPPPRKSSKKNKSSAKDTKKGKSSKKRPEPEDDDDDDEDWDDDDDD